MRTNPHEWGRRDRQSRATALLECGSLTPAFPREGCVSRVAPTSAAGQPKRNSKFRTPNATSPFAFIRACRAVASSRRWVHSRFNSSGSRDEIDTGFTAQHRTHDARNEITHITGEDAVQPEYDHSGNTTKFPAARKDDFTVEVKAKYDAWDRLVRLADSADETLAEYRYDATGRRIVRTIRAPSESSASAASPSSAPGSPAPGGPPPHVNLPPQARVPGQPGAGPGPGVQEEPPATGGTITYHDYFTPSWQLAEVREEGGGGDTVREQYVWSPAALAGPSGRIDDLVLRDRDTDDEGVLDERLYAQQDAVRNVSSVVRADGDVAERYVFDAYGTLDFLDPGFGSRNASCFNWRVGSQGLVQDPHVSGAGLICTRFRYRHPTLGRWATPDPLGPAEHPNLYSALRSSPVNAMDESGLLSGFEVGFLAFMLWLLSKRNAHAPTSFEDIQRIPRLERELDIEQTAALAGLAAGLPARQVAGSLTAGWARQGGLRSGAAWLIRAEGGAVAYASANQAIFQVHREDGFDIGEYAGAVFEQSQLIVLAEGAFVGSRHGLGWAGRRAGTAAHSLGRQMIHTDAIYAKAVGPRFIGAEHGPALDLRAHVPIHLDMGVRVVPHGATHLGVGSPVFVLDARALAQPGVSPERLLTNIGYTQGDAARYLVRGQPRAVLVDLRGVSQSIPRMHKYPLFTGRGVTYTHEGRFGFTERAIPNMPLGSHHVLMELLW